MSLNLDEAYKKCNKLMHELHVVVGEFNALYKESKDTQLIGKHVKNMNDSVEKCYSDCLNEMGKYYTDYFSSLKGASVKKPVKKTVRRRN